MCALVTKETLPANIDQDVARISWKYKSGFLPEFVLAYLNSSFGQDYMARHSSGMVQQGLSLQKVRDIPLPIMSREVQRSIAMVVESALLCRRNAEKAMANADKQISSGLGLENWQAPEPLSYVRRSSEAFAAGRLDAEYFSPNITSMLATLGRDGLSIRDVAPARKERFIPASNGDFHYIEIGGLGNDGCAQAELLPQREAPSRATQIVRVGDIITSTVRPIRRLSAIIESSQDGFVCSSGFVVLQPLAIRPEALLTYLRLPPVCALMDLHTSASMYPAISEADLLRLPIPQIPLSVQEAIEASVQLARRARQRAKQLLDAAKRAVEIAIESSESDALAFLDQTLAEAGEANP